MRARLPAPVKPWRVADQPGLKQALESAPLLQTESLGEPARGVKRLGTLARAEPRRQDLGCAPDLLQGILRADLALRRRPRQPGRLHKQRLADHHQFYLSGRALGFDGKYYIATPRGRRATWICSFTTPRPMRSKSAGRLFAVSAAKSVRSSPAGWADLWHRDPWQPSRPLHLRPCVGKSGERFRALGPRHPNGAWSRYVMGWTIPTLILPAE